jgi:hypothetical protein
MRSTYKENKLCCCSVERNIMLLWNKSILVSVMFTHEAAFCKRILNCFLLSCFAVGFKCISIQWVHRVGIVSIATRLLAGQSRVQARYGQETLLFSKTARPALGPTQPPIHWISGVGQPEHEVSRSSPSTAKVKNEWSYNSTRPIYLHDMDRDNFTLFF